jgi:nucleotide-binding universal stress UspA family protein
VDDLIVVGTDGSETAARALAEAMRISKALDGKLHVVSAFERLQEPHVRGGTTPPTDQVHHPLPTARVESILSDAEARGRQDGLEVMTHAVEEDPADALLRVAQEIGATMIVVGSKGMHGARRFAIGNVPNKVSHHAHCNVLIVATDRG